MMKKPNLEHAEVIRRTPIPESVKKFLTPEALANLEKVGAKEYGTANLAVGEWFVIEEYCPGEYHKFKTDGSRSELSLFRMTGGCNNINAFYHTGAEKSEDYDSLPDNVILYLPNKYEKAIEIIEEKYIGKKFRVVARSADGMDQYGHRYYLFVVE